MDKIEEKAPPAALVYKLNMTKTDFRGIWIKTVINKKGEIDMIIDTGSSRNIISKKEAERLGITPQWTDTKITTLGGHEFPISRPQNVQIEINGYPQSMEFVIVDTDIDFAILGLPFTDTLSSINLTNKTIYNGKERYVFSKYRRESEMKNTGLTKQIIYAINDEFAVKEMPIYDVNRKTLNDIREMTPCEQDVIKLQEEMAERLKGVEDKDITDEMFNTMVNNMDSFSYNRKDIGHFNGPLEMKIRLTDENPIYEPIRPLPYGFKDIVAEHEATMKEMGVIVEAESEYRANIVLAKKKDHGQKGLSIKDLLRPCQDYRKLNKKMVTENYPIPNATEIIERLDGCKFFSQYDLSNAFWACTIEENSRKYTAFQGQDGKCYVYTRAAFGLKNSPMFFSKCLEYSIRDLRYLNILNYLDDIIIGSKTAQEHLMANRIFLQRMAAHGWKIRLQKCTLFAKQVKFLGYMISEQGIQPCPDRVKLYQEWPRPKNPRQLITFLQSLNYYKRFIKSFAAISAPLYDLTRKESDFVWTGLHEEAFLQLKEGISHFTLLNFPKVHAPYRVTTDWSPAAISFVMEQPDENGVFKPIVYGGKKLSKSESNYSSYMGELVAGYYCFQSLRKYLLCASVTGIPNTWRTDNRAVEYAQTRKDLYGRVGRIILFLEQFNYKIEHVPSKENNADPLSRIEERNEIDYDQDEMEETPDDYESHPFLLVKDDLNNVDYGNLEERVLFAALYLTNDEMTEEVVNTGDIDLQEVVNEFDADKMNNMQINDWTETQQQDVAIKRIIQHLEGDTITAEEAKAMGKKTKQLFDKRDRLFVKNEVLMMTHREDISNTDRELVVVPREREDQLIEEFHKGSHFGVEKTFRTMLQHCWMHEMYRKVRTFVLSCPTCMARKGPQRPYQLELKTQQVGAFNQKIGIDLISMEESESGFKKALTVVDFWSGYAECIPLKGGTTEEVATALFNGWIAKHSVCEELQSDRGPEFRSQVMEELCKMLKIKKISTSPYAPFSNGRVEKLNRTIKDSLSMLMDLEKNNWDELLPLIVFYYNISINLTTGFSPFELRTGTLPTLPLAMTMDRRTASYTHTEYVRKIMKRIEEVTDVVYKNTKASQEYQSRTYNKKLHGESLNVNDLVRVKYQGPPPKGVSAKLMSRWRGPYRILEKLNDKAYVVELPFRGMLKPQVQNIKNLWKVGVVADEDADDDPIENPIEEAAEAEITHTRSGRRTVAPERYGDWE